MIRTEHGGLTPQGNDSAEFVRLRLDQLFRTLFVSGGLTEDEIVVLVVEEITNLAAENRIRRGARHLREKRRAVFKLPPGDKQ